MLVGLLLSTPHGAVIAGSCVADLSFWKEDWRELDKLSASVVMLDFFVKQKPENGLTDADG